MTVPPPSTATRDMRIFQDQIIPVLQTKLTNETIKGVVSKPLVSERKIIIDTLEADMKTLTRLYNIHFNQHPWNIASSPHPPDDPIYELEYLLRLDGVIQNLQSLAASNEDVTLCDTARMFFSNRTELDIVRLGNSLTDTFKPYKDYFSTYTTITPKLMLSPSQGLASYKIVKDLIAPPFEIRRIEDLIKLRSSTEVAYEKNVNELEKNIEIPIIKASFDRTILMWILPTIVLVLLHLINSYFSRSYRLLNKTTKDKLSAFSKQEFINHGPHFFLTLRESVAWESTNWIYVFARRIRAVMTSIIKVAVISSPESVFFVYFYNVYYRHSGIFQKSFWIGFGCVICVFMLCESVLLFKQWSNLFTNKE
jgi:hypothetical protein